MSHNKKRVTIKDIARETGYSIATVSRVINGTNMYYTQETKRKIEEAVAKFDYRPDLIARGLKERKTFNIAYLVPQIDEFYVGIFNGMQSEANTRGYSIVTLSSNYCEKQELIHLNQIKEKRYDGLIIATGLLNDPDGKVIRELHNQLPIVFVENISKKYDIPSVSIDVEEICKNTVKYLMSIGHRRIAYASAPRRFDTLKYRYRGYVRAFEESGIPFDETIVVFDKELERTNFNGSYNLMKKVFREKKFTAMFVMSDWAAFTAIRAAKELGKKVPDDISIIGFDDLPFTEFSEPSLTTISQDNEGIGSKAISMMLDILDGKAVDDVVLEGKLVKRHSVAPRL